MAQLTYENQITGLVVVDPYNDFISEGGKVWDRIKVSLKATGASRTCCGSRVCSTAGIRAFYALHRQYRPGDYNT